MLQKLKVGESLGRLAPEYIFDSVPRIHVANLSFHRFFNDFALLKRPVVIEGVDVGVQFEFAWQEIRQLCGSMRLTKLKHLDQHSLAWAKLEEVRVNTSLAELMDEIEEQGVQADRMLFDSSII